MKILLTGAAGMLGHDLQRELHHHYQVVGVDIGDFDITDQGKTISTVARNTPDLVINAAAYTDVDRAEKESRQAMAVNRDGARSVALGAATAGAKLIQISTDFIFDGETTNPYTEHDTPNPINTYGRAKWEGEKAVREVLGERAMILRTAWLYGEHGKNFVTTILERAARQSSLKVVFDQVGSPTYTLDLSHAIVQLLEKGTWAPILNVANAGVVSRHEYACTIVDLAGLHNVQVKPIPSAKLKSLAPRPVYSALDDSLFVKRVGHGLRHWREALKDYLAHRRRD